MFLKTMSYMFNLGFGYPWPSSVFSPSKDTLPSDEWDALDTNGDGSLNGLDDPYSCYYPGDDFVDMVGL
jgi:beta-mannanase